MIFRMVVLSLLPRLTYENCKIIDTFTRQRDSAVKLSREMCRKAEYSNFYLNIKSVVGNFRIG